MATNHTNINELKNTLSKKPDLPLKFYFEGTAINPGYHVTEIKYATIKSLDCGRKSSTEAWDEITIQLLDGSPKSTQGHMSATKFLGIIGKALEKLKEVDAPFLFFEFAPNNGPIRKLSVKSIEHTGEEITVSLGGENAVCKPFQRSKVVKAATALGKLIPTVTSSKECCSDSATPNSQRCC